jgi:hypothetical protein
LPYCDSSAARAADVINTVKSGFDALGSDMGNICSDLDASVARLDAKVVELDIFCKDPLVLVEVTTFLGKKEFDKLHKFARLGALIAKREGKKNLMLFCTFGVNPRISSMVARLCGKNNIYLLTDNVER